MEKVEEKKNNYIISLNSIEDVRYKYINILESSEKYRNSKPNIR
jgi:hypothetical protein